MEGGDLSLSTSIDQKVVQMKFDNAEFEQRIAATLRSLDALNKGMKLEGATKGLHDLGAASKNVNLQHVEQGVQSIADRFKAMSVVGITALATIAHQAVYTGQQLIKSLTIDPIKTGLTEYETNLNSIQTILANTGLEGKAGLGKVTAALDELNAYSDQTIYNFSEMAKNIGTFTAAGVKLEVAADAIKGIANLAAVSGSNSQQAAAAMYQLSQAISAGRVSLEDWNSVVNAGMGGKVFQDALMETARVHGVAIDKMVKDAGSFRLTLQEGWLTGEILTETLSKFTGDLTAAQLKTMGYNEQQIQGILKMGRIAQEAATKVKTATQLINTLQEAAVSGWAQTWQLVIGDFEEARTMFTSINNVLGELIKGSADARNELVKDWKELGGRTVLIEAAANAWKALVSVVRPIRDAFREIFPPVTAKQLYDMTVIVRDFARGLILSSESADNLRRTFAGVFAIFGIAWDLISEGIGLIFRLIGVVSDGSGSFLEFTANIGDFIVGIRKAIKDGDIFAKVFDKIGDGIEFVIRLVQKASGVVEGLFDDFDGTDAARSVTGLAARLEPLGRIGDVIANVWEKVDTTVRKAWETFYPIASRFTEFMSGMGVDISESLQGINLQGIVAALSGGALAAFILSLRGLADGVGDVLESVTNSLNAMQTTLRAATLLQIALAIATLAVAVVALSKVDTGGLTRSLTAITVMFTQLLAAMLIFEKLSGFTGFAKMPFIAASMILLGVAINVLAVAVKNLADLDWNELSRGLTGVTVLLGGVIAALRFMPPSAGLLTTAAGLVVLSAAIKLLATSVEDISSLSWEEMAKGLTGVGALLASLTLFTRYAALDKAGIVSGAGIILLAAGLKILASATKDFSGIGWEEMGRGLTAMAGALALVGAALYLIPPTSVFAAAGVVVLASSLGMIGEALEGMSGMSWAEIGRGLTVMAGALALIGAALYLIPPTALLSAAGVLVVAASLGMIGDALKGMAQMSWGDIGKSLTLLAGALTIITIALTAMIAALPGAAALVVVAGALLLLTPILDMYAQMSWGEIGKGLTVLAGVLLTIAGVGLLIAPVVPILLGLGLAITLLGAGTLAAGAGVFLFATALTAASVSGVAATTALVAMVGALAGLIPTVLTQLGLGIVAFAGVMATASPAFTAAIVAILTALIDAIVVLTPKILDALYKLLTALLVTLGKYVPPMVDMGAKLLIAFLNGIAKNIGGVVDAAVNVIVAFLGALQKNQPRVIQAGVDLIIGYINGLASAIRANSGRMGEAGANLGAAIIEGMARGLLGGVGKIASIAKDVALTALKAAKNALGIKSPSKEFEEVGEDSDEGLAKGLLKFGYLVEDAAGGVGNDALNALKKTMADINDVVASDIKTPVIRPVLDISNVREQARKMGRLYRGKPIQLDGVYSKTNETAAEFEDGRYDPDTPDGFEGRTNFTYIQNNNSPKALSTAEVYRQTNNQLATVRGALPN